MSYARQQLLQSYTCITANKRITRVDRWHSLTCVISINLSTNRATSRGREMVHIARLADYAFFSTENKSHPQNWL